MSELIGIAAIAAIIGLVVWRIMKPYCDSRVSEAQRAIQAGGFLIGWDFIAGPIVVPPEAVLPPAMAAQWREAARAAAGGVEENKHD